MATQIIPSEVSYRTVEQISPQYRLKKVPLNNIPSSTIGSGIITDTQSQVLEWKFPSNEAVNLAKSMIGFDIVYGANGPAGSKTYAYEYQDCFSLAMNIQLGDPTNPGGLCDLNHVQRFTKISRKIGTPYEEYKTYPSEGMLYPSNLFAKPVLIDVTTTDIAATDTMRELCDSFTIGSTGSAGHNYYRKNYDPSIYQTNEASMQASVNFDEPRYVSYKDVSTAGTNNVRSSYYFPFNGIKDSIFSYDKDILSVNDLTLRLTAGLLKNIAYVGTSSTLPQVNAATAETSNVRFENVYLWLATEQNLAIKGELMKQYLSGTLKFQIPYTTANKISSNGTTTNIQISIPPTIGRLKKILHTVWDGSGGIIKQYDASNAGGVKISKYRTYLDNNSLQDDIVDVSKSQDYILYNKQYCKDTVILNKDNYYRNWFHMDKFYSKNDKIDEDNLNAGLILTQPLKYTIECQTAAVPLEHITYLTFSKVVNISPLGIVSSS